ncbi:MAG: hypothetical protein JF599_07400 [Verrucomicrobia bacterium]|nr:hypothetical protein [Verrucomicrobiota bacterium]
MIPIKIHAIFGLASLLSLAPTARSDDTPRTIEVLSYGRALADVKISLGKTDYNVSLGMTPPGFSAPFGTEKTLVVSREEVIDGKSRVTPLVSLALPAGLVAPLVLIVPPPKDADPAVPYQARLIDQDLPLKPAVMNIYNLTSVPMVIQSGQGENLVEVAPWGRGTFSPKTDSKNRAHIRVAYHKSDGSWALIKDSVSAFRPGSYCRMRIVLAAEGLGTLVDVTSKDHNTASVYIDEQQVALLDPLKSAPVGEAPVYKPPYEHVEVVMGPKNFKTEQPPPSP